MPELATSVFVIPRDLVKNGLDRYTVLNRVAKSVIDSRRGEHPEFVFTEEEPGGERHPIMRINNSGWKVARRRAAGVGFEDRKLLLGHKSAHVTTHYSAPEEIGALKAFEKLSNLGARKSPALAIVRPSVERKSLI